MVSTGKAWRERWLGIGMGVLGLVAMPVHAAGWADTEGLERLSPVRLYAVPEPEPPSEQVMPASPAPMSSETTLYGLQWQPTDTPMVQITEADAGAVPAARTSALDSRLGLRTDGMASWVYRDAQGLDLAFGALPGSGLKLAGSAPLTGLRLQHGRIDDGTPLAPGAVGYASALGWLDYSPWSEGAGAVRYGVSAGQASVRYGWRSDLTVEGQVQTAAKLNNVGLGGVYALGDWGRVRAGATHSRYQNVQGSRYNLGYSVWVSEWLELGYRAEYALSGYSDLSRYSAGPLPQSRVQGTLETDVLLSQWGTLSGTFSELRDGRTTVQRMGIAHSLALPGHVHLKWAADRDIVSGDYGVRLNLSLPVDLLGD